MTGQVTELSERELLDEVEVLRRRQLETGVALLRLVAEFARQHGEATVDPEAARLPGRERPVRLGGEGTPLVAEFACSVLAARLGLSAYAGGRLVADLLDLDHRLPLLWARVQALEVSEGHARYVARKTRHLSPAEAACVDASPPPRRLSWTRFETLVEAAIVAADPDTAAERERATARDTFAEPPRSTDHRGFYIRADFATIARIDATVAHLAGLQTWATPPPGVKAVLILANPAQAVKILQAHTTWQHQNRARQPSSPRPPQTRQRSVSTPPPQPSCSTRPSCCPRCGCTPTSPAAPSAGSKEQTRSPPNGSAATSVNAAGSRSPRSWTRSTRSRSTPGRSHADIGKPCTY